MVLETEEEAVMAENIVEEQLGYGLLDIKMLKVKERRDFEKYLSKMQEVQMHPN